MFLCVGHKNFLSTCSCTAGLITKLIGRTRYLHVILKRIFINVQACLLIEAKACDVFNQCSSVFVILDVVKFFCSCTKGFISRKECGNACFHGLVTQIFCRLEAVLPVLSVS